MNVDWRRPVRTRPLGVSRRQGSDALRAGESGFSALELLVIVVIVCVVVAIGVPSLHAQAKTSVLDLNLRSLGVMVEEHVLEGYSPEYKPSGEGDPANCLSARLEESLHAIGGAGYMNPVAGSDMGRTILNSRSVPKNPGSVPPAVFMTDAPECQYQTFGSLAETSRRLLAGALIVAFNTQASTVDVFYVDEDGRASDKAVRVPTG